MAMHLAHSQTWQLLHSPSLAHSLPPQPKSEHLWVGPNPPLRLTSPTQTTELASKPSSTPPPPNSLPASLLSAPPQLLPSRQTAHSRSHKHSPSLTAAPARPPSPPAILYTATHLALSQTSPPPHTASLVPSLSPVP